MTFANLSGLTALVTGGSRGIGRAIAAQLRANGAEVVIHGTNAAKLDEVAGELGGARTIVADLFDPASIEKIAAQAGEVDILINNAGITRDALFLRQKPEQWDEVLTVNLTRVVALTRALYPAMAKQGFGRIVNVTSIIAHTGNVGQTNYATAKAALTGFTKSLAKETARKGVTVNAVAPGFIATDMTDTLPEAIRENIMKSIPAQRFGETADIAAAVAFLASREAGYITGSTVHVNGGLYV
ncbi:MAG: 3-oxoacyl-ACP reductase FabG [Pseudomonadaceae bacterium]|nr:3-oxoacyl-ACP reductase FabG [Pseudomonadaceae bacterium]